MNLAEVFSGMPAAEPFPGLADAWHWSPNRRFHFVAAVSGDGGHAFQVNTLDSYDEEVVRGLLVFVREREAEVLGDGRPLVPVHGFSGAGKGFDTAVAAAPGTHQYHARENAELHGVTYAVFPGWHYEFSGRETAQEAAFQVAHPQGLRITRLDRDPVPFLKMRYRNTRTSAASIGPDRGLAKPAVLYRELELLEGADGSFVEFETFRGEVWRAEWADGFQLTGEGREHRLGREETVAFAAARLTGT
jgi:hypothetical protein